MQNPATEKKKPVAETQDESTPQRKPVSNREKEFNEAVERVYQRYGTDLPAFYRDVQKELVKRG